MPEPMTPERLAEIKKAFKWNERTRNDWCMSDELIGEIERLRDAMNTKYWEGIREDNERMRRAVKKTDSTILAKDAEVERLREDVEAYGIDRVILMKQLTAAETVVEFVAECHTGCGAAIGCPTCKLIDAYRAAKET